jgi:pimeloyl-ACP methyl ester carboxylesterase
MPQLIEGAGVELATYPHGDSGAAALLLIHDMGAVGEALGPIAVGAEALGLHAVAYDRRGYGSSGAPEPYTGTTVVEQSQDALAVLDALGIDDAIVAGEGFGALIALDVARRFPQRVRAVAAVDPLLFELVPEGNELLSAQRLELEQALADKRLEFDAAFFADFAGLATFPATRRELRAMDLPVVVATHETAPAHVAAAAAALAELLPRATHAEGAGLLGALKLLLT